MKNIKNIIFYLLLITIGSYIILISFVPDKVMDIIGYRTFIVLSDSMDPTIKRNDLILVKKVDETDLDEGDIISFNVYISEMNQVSSVTHYIYDIDKTGEVPTYRTIGENKNDQFDTWKDEDGNLIEIIYSDIEGKYIFRIPFVGNIQKAVSNPILLGLLTINGIVIYYTVKYIRKTIKENK